MGTVHVSGRNASIALRNCPLLSYLIPFVSSSHSFNTIRLPVRYFWTLMAMVNVLCPDSHTHRIALRRSLWHESGWSLATAAAMPHGDYLNRMAHTHAHCVHVYTYTYVDCDIMCLMIIIIISTAPARAIPRYYTAATAAVTVQCSIVQVRSSHAVGVTAQLMPVS